MVNINIQAEWTFPTHIRLASGQLSSLKHHLARMGIKSVMIITDKGLVHSSHLKKILQTIDRSHIAFGVFSDLDGVANRHLLEQAITLYKNGGFSAIIAFGGGSVIDLTKLTALFSAQSSDYHNLILPHKNALPPPVIVIPTLAGSGAEIEETAYIATEPKQGGLTLSDHRLMPKLVLLDPEITATAPPYFIAGAGMNALTHAIDSWCNPSFNPIADALAVETMRLVFNHLPKAVSDPKNIKSHAYILSASISGAIAATKGLGATTALSHSICQHFKSHFGMTAGVLLPYVLVFNQPVIEQRIQLLNNQLDIKGGFTAFLHHILNLRKETGVPVKLTTLLKDQKIKAKDKSLIDNIAIEDPAADENPLRFNKKAALKVLNAAINGKLTNN